MRIKSINNEQLIIKFSGAKVRKNVPICQETIGFTAYWHIGTLEN